MNVAVFCHSILSDWHDRGVHLLRGVASELVARRHRVRVFEPRDGTSVRGLLAETGAQGLLGFRRAYPSLRPTRYDPRDFDLDAALDGADLVFVDESADPEIVRAIGGHRVRAHAQLFFRASSPRAAAAITNLAGYDAVLARTRTVADALRAFGWTRELTVWHDAADTRLFHPRPSGPHLRDLVWVGGYGPRLPELLFEPVRRLNLRARVYGAGWPGPAITECERSGIEFAGYVPDHEVPGVLAGARVTVDFPNGAPSVHAFEALACGIPLVVADGIDPVRLFRPGIELLPARDGVEMARQIRTILDDSELARCVAVAGRRAVLMRHTCAHRADEVLALASSRCAAA
ncbi:MAG TPA: glycosyltransferase [Planctomycetota bacterium]|nr:glycosyltransferase [Planctomycetota bacterium]